MALLDWPRAMQTRLTKNVSNRLYRNRSTPAYFSQDNRFYLEWKGWQGTPLFCVPLGIVWHTAGMDTKEVLLAEYDKAQDSAQHHDNAVWSVTNVTWAAMMVLLGFVISNIEKAELRIIITLSSVLGLLLVCFQWENHRVCRNVKLQKYRRCKEIEKELGMKQHTELVYRGGYLSTLYRTISVLFIFAWFYVLGYVWTR
jgi:hypothetical protein